MAPQLPQKNPSCAACGVPFRGFCFAGRMPDDHTSGTESWADWEVRRFDTRYYREQLYSARPRGYDPKVLGVHDVAWTLEMMVLIPDLDPKRLETARWSDAALMRAALDRSFPDIYDHGRWNVQLHDFFWYRSYQGSVHHEPAYPLHRECKTILDRLLAGHTGSTNGHDAEVLYAACCNLNPGNCRNVLSGLQYHEPCLPHVGPLDMEVWDSAPGWEFLLASPLHEDPAGIRADLKRSFTCPAKTVDLSARAGSDALSTLPWELLNMVLSHVDDTSLMHLEKASWHVHRSLHDSDEFWQGRIRNHMAWFPELRTYLEAPWPGVTQNPKALVLWAMRASEAREGLRGPYMSIANRRRIWHACGQIADHYNALHPRLVHGDDPVASEIRDTAWLPYLPFVAHPAAAVVSPPSETFWLRSWAEVHYEMVLETFWDMEGSLVGISVAPSGKRRLVGLDDSEDGVRKKTAIIPDTDWISEIMLHIPNLSSVRKDAVQEASPKGITVRFVHRQPLEMGDVGLNLCLRLFRPQEDATIVGVKGQIGVVNGRRQIIRFGTIQAPSPDRHTSQPFTKRPVPTVERYLWAANQPYLDGFYAWDFPQLGMRAFEDGRGRDHLSDTSHDDLVPLEAFVWAKTLEETRSLTRLTAAHVDVNLIGMAPVGGDETCIASLRAEYTQQSGLGQRQVGGLDVDGQPPATKDVRHFEIDGPGGEYVARVKVSTGGNGLQLATNRMRETSWMYEATESWRGIEDGEILRAGIGVAVGFSIEPRLRATMRVGGLLTVPRSVVSSKRPTVGGLQLSP